MLGGGLGEDLDGWWLVVAAASGIAILVTLAVAQGLLGQHRSHGLGGVAAGPLGRLGARHIASWVMVVLMIGWFGVNAGVGGSALGRLLDTPEAVGIGLFAAMLVAIVWRGLATLSWVALAAGVATVMIGAYGVVLARGAEAPVVVEGSEGDPLAALGGATLVVGYGAAFALRAPDFTLDLGRSRHVVWCALVGLATPLAVFIAAGAVLQQATGTWNLAEVLVQLEAAAIAQLFLALGFAGSVMTNLHSGAAAIVDAQPRTGRLVALLAVGLAGSALAVGGLAERMLDYLVLMAIIAPGLVVLSAIYWTSGSPSRDKWGIPALIAWTLGFAVGVAFGLAESPLALPAAIALTGGTFLTTTAVLGRRGPPWETNDEHRP